MVDFNNLPSPLHIPDIKQDVKLGDRVRCYQTSNKEANSFIGYATVTEILDEDSNFHWCENEGKLYINYAYYVVK